MNAAYESASEHLSSSRDAIGVGGMEGGSGEHDRLMLACLVMDATLNIP